MQKNKIFVGLLLGIFLISMVSMVQADLVFEQSTEVDLKFVCINNGYCSSSAVCNVSVFSPDDTTILSGVQATQAIDLSSFNVTLNSTQTSELGEYSVGGFCLDGGVTEPIDFTFDITPTGLSLDTSQGVIVLGLMLLLLFLTAAFLIIGLKVERTSVKVFLLALGALFFLLTLGVSINAIKQLMLLGSVFSGTFVSLYRLFLILISGGMIAIVLYLVTMAVTAFKKSRGIFDDDDF